MGLTLALLAASACHHEIRPASAAHPVEVASAEHEPRACYGAFIDQLLKVQEERAAHYKVETLSEQLSDLLRRLGLLASQIEARSSRDPLLCPVVARFGALPPPAQAGAAVRCGRSSFHQSDDPPRMHRDPQVGRALARGELDSARRSLLAEMREWPLSRGVGRTPACDCATRFLAQTLLALLDELSQPTLSRAQTQALLAFAVAVDALSEQALLVDDIAGAVQLGGLWMICADLPSLRDAAALESPRPPEAVKRRAGGKD